MKLFYIYLFICPLLADTHEERNLPSWLRSNLNKVSIEEAKLNKPPVEYLIQEFDKSKIKEQVAGKEIKLQFVDVKSTFIRAKRRNVLELLTAIVDMNGIILLGCLNVSHF